MGQLGEDGGQLRPHIVWFGEAVPLIVDAENLCWGANVFAAIGTSLVVYPAAGLARKVPKGIKSFFIDPNASQLEVPYNFTIIEETATKGVAKMRDLLLADKELR